MDTEKGKNRGSACRHTWKRAGTGRGKELKGTAPPPCAVAQTLNDGRSSRSSEANRPVALHTHSYTYVFNRVSHHTHRTHLQRAYCTGLYGAPPAEPNNNALYGELDERLRLADSTLKAVRNKQVLESFGEESQGVVDTVALRQAVNSSLSCQIEFFTDCMVRYCGDKCPCDCTGCRNCSGYPAYP